MNISNNTAAAVFLIFISGCASTVQDARNSSPVIDVTSQKSAKSVSICIADSWEISVSGSAFTIASRETAKGFSVSIFEAIPAFNYRSLLYLSDVEDTSNGSRILLYRKGVLAGGEPVLDAVRKCQ